MSKKDIDSTDTVRTRLENWLRKTPWPLLISGLVYIIAGIALQLVGAVLTAGSENSSGILQAIGYWLVFGGFNVGVLHCVLWCCCSVGELAVRTLMSIVALGVLLFATLLRVRQEVLHTPSLQEQLFIMLFFLGSASPVFVFLRLVFHWRIVQSNAVEDTIPSMQLSIRDLLTITLIVASFMGLFQVSDSESSHDTAVWHETFVMFCTSSAFCWLALIPVSYLILYSSRTINDALIVCILAPFMATIPTLLMVATITSIGENFVTRDEYEDEMSGLATYIVTFIAMIMLFLYSLVLLHCKHLGYELRTSRQRHAKATDI